MAQTLKVRGLQGYLWYGEIRIVLYDVIDEAFGVRILEERKSVCGSVSEGAPSPRSRRTLGEHRFVMITAIHRLPAYKGPSVSLDVTQAARCRLQDLTSWLHGRESPARCEPG